MSTGKDWAKILRDGPPVAPKAEAREVEAEHKREADWGDSLNRDRLPLSAAGAIGGLVSFWREKYSNELNPDTAGDLWVWQVRYPNGHHSRYTATAMQLIQALKDASGNPDRGVSVEVLAQGKTADAQLREDLAADPGGDGGIGAELERRNDLDGQEMILEHELRAEEEAEMQGEAGEEESCS